MQILQDNNLGNHLTLKAIGRSMTIDYLPNSGKFDNIMITLVDCNGNEEAKQVFPCNQPARCFFNVETSGEYSLHIFAGPTTDCLYHSLYGGVNGIPMLFNGKNFTFKASPFTLANARFVNELPISADFLSKCLGPTFEIQCDIFAIRSLASEIKRGRIFPESIMIGVNDWVAKNISYDLDSLVGKRYLNCDNSAAAVLQTRRGVCCGYHNLTSALLRACGIPTLGIVCFSLGRHSNGWWYDRDNMIQETNHIMTAAFVSKRWRLMDVTWNSDNEYRQGRVVSRSGLGATRTYCDATIPFISLSHRFDDYE